jgi:hypothetical protein
MRQYVFGEVERRIGDDIGKGLTHIEEVANDAVTAIVEVRVWRDKLDESGASIRMRRGGRIS